jgi:hypothetical protein
MSKLKLQADSMFNAVGKYVALKMTGDWRELMGHNLI